MFVMVVEINAFSNISGMYLCLQDDPNGQKILVLLSADMA
jgi:hypothetical protein